MSNAGMLIGRLLLALLFVLAGYGKLMAPGPTQAYIGSAGLPVPELAYYVTLAVELGVGIAFALGLLTRVSALVLAAWTVVTAVIFHTNFADMAQMIQFLKNMSITGGLLYAAAVGGGAFSLDALLFRRQPSLVR